MKRKSWLMSIFLGFFLSCQLVTGTTAFAAGLFGSPETVSRQAGGLNTAVGYFYHAGTYGNRRDIDIRQSHVYSQMAYGASPTWECYARIGLAGLKIEDAFQDHEKFFASLGGKAFYPAKGIWGVGAFVQGTYYLDDFTDTVSRNATMKVKNLWDIHCGVAFQVTLPWKAKMYIGPYWHDAEAKMTLASNVREWGYAAGHYRVESNSTVGGYAGVDVPLAKGFHLQVEGQYSDRFSAGAAISYTY